MGPLTIHIENGKFAIISTLIDVGANVLDVGCGTGELGEILRRTKKCVVTGIEIDPRALEVAKQKLNNVTLKTVKQMITDAGFQITYITSTCGQNLLDCKFLLKNPSIIWKNLLAC